jgi:hypothetical protein
MFATLGKDLLKIQPPLTPRAPFLAIRQLPTPLTSTMTRRRPFDARPLQCNIRPGMDAQAGMRRDERVAIGNVSPMHPV